MKERTWKSIFKAMYYIAAIPIIMYYFMPEILYLFDATTGKPTPLFIAIMIYAFVYIVLLLAQYFYSTQTNAEVIGLWTIAPPAVKGTVLLNGKTTTQNGLVNLLSDSDAKTFLAETFTFSFFVFIDKSSVELIPGEKLAQENGLFQRVLVVPGAYTISIDPLHETLAVVFDSYKTRPYRVDISTLSVQRWHQITISVEGRITDIYQNGTLIKSVPLPNVIGSQPGNPYVIMNSDMYAKIALIQAWPQRLIETAITNNYRTNTDSLGAPILPEPSNIFGIPNFEFCLGSNCFGPAKTKETALATVDYTYA
jgi:hypothetical protein